MASEMSAELVVRGAASLGAILGVAGGGIAVVQSVRRRPLVESVLARRWFTWAILGPVWLAAAAWGPARVAVLTVLTLIAVVEFSKLRPALVLFDRWLLFVFAVGSVPLISLTDVDPVAVVVALAVGSVVTPLLFADIDNGPARVGDVCFGGLLVILPFMLLQEIAAATSGSLFFAVGLAIALSDVGAFLAGSIFGSRRLASAISPNKTYVGVAGNFAGAMAGVLIAAAAGITPWSALWLAPIIAVGALVGDLMVSLLKRSRGVKDTGDWLPGFGGLLDRVDSLLVAAPIVFIAISVFGAST
jgi:phosphatidate cytidylyltransferase